MFSLSTLVPSCNLFAVAGFIVFSYVSMLSIYRLYFHPLANVPGPRLAAISEYWWAYHFWSGHWHTTLEKAHNRYGPVVRIASNELSFSSAASIAEIYGHAKGDHKPFLKTAFYDVPASVKGQVPGIASERNPEKHRNVRRILSHAFSAAALRDQADVVGKYVDLFVNGIKDQGDVAEGIDVAEWLNWVTFDIIGDLAFGESFGCCETRKTHFWIDAFNESLYAGLLMNMGKRVTFANVWLMLTVIVKPSIMKNHALTTKFNKEQAVNRKSKPNDRADFFSHILKSKDEEAQSDMFLSAQAQTLIIAGSETTSTLLASLIAYLLKDEQKLKILQQEVRGAFSTASEITSDSTQSLPYLCACIEEGLRIAPPVAFGLPRTSPGAFVDGLFVPADTIVSNHGYTTQMSSAHFASPKSFSPQRWLPAAHPLHDSYFRFDTKEASKAFSIGPRACIGMNLAYMEMRVLLARLVWEFEWDLVNKDLDWRRDVEVYILAKKPEVRVRFTGREKTA